MNTKDVAKKLSSLVHLDMDAFHAYGQAIDAIDDTSIASRLRRYQQDHERHADEFISYIKFIGEKTPDKSRDFKGFFIEGFTAIRSTGGTESALRAMETNEKTTNRKYDEASKWDLPAEAMAIVKKNLSDEREHLQFVQDTLSARSWEQGHRRAG